MCVLLLLLIILFQYFIIYMHMYTRYTYIITYIISKKLNHVFLFHFLDIYSSNTTNWYILMNKYLVGNLITFYQSNVPMLVPQFVFMSMFTIRVRVVFGLGFLLFLAKNVGVVHKKRRKLVIYCL